jgi:hypothetical protein
MIETKKTCCYQCLKRTQTCHIDCPDRAAECEENEFTKYLRNIQNDDYTFAEEKKQRINLKRRQTKNTGVGKR